METAVALDPSIALQTQVPNPANLISGFLDLGLKKNALDRGNATLLSDIAQRKAESRISQAGANVAEANQQPLIQQQAAITDAAKVGAQRSHFQLTREQGQAALQQAGALLSDPRVASGDPNQAIAAVIEAKRRAVDLGVPEAQAEVMFGRLVTQAHDDPKSLRQTLANTVGGGLSPEGQAAQNLIPAGSRTQVGGVSPQGNPTVFQRDQFGGGLTQTALPQQGQQQAPQAPLQFPAGENADTYKQLSTEREAGRTTVSQAPTIHALNHEILDELNKATTGQYAGIIAKGQSLAGMLGLSLTGNNEQERAASAYDLIDKYTTQAATRAAQGMGNDTATALNAQLKQNASVERNPTAIRKSIKFNDAILSGAEAYQGGLEKAIQANPQADIFIKRQFDREWAKNFDPVIMQIYQAKKSGDTAELNDLIKSLGKRAPEIAAKAQRLQALMQGQ